MEYKVIDIYDQDFGCEGRPDGAPICCEVIVEKDNKQKTVLIKEENIIKNKIEKGMFISEQLFQNK